MTTDVDELDTVSAIWILASNDENPLITYEGIRSRLGLPADFSVKALIRKRGELFRQGARVKHLDDWKAEMRGGSWRPSWIRAAGDEGAQQKAIDALTVDDVFRSQFRAVRKAERSPINVISWGLDHIDRLRKSQWEARHATAKRWEMWLAIAVGVLGVVAQVMIAWLKPAP